MPALKQIRRFAVSCGLLLVPVILWNVAFANRLPPMFARGEFWRDIPVSLELAESVMRAFVFILPFAMPLEVAGVSQRRGLWLFLLGLLIYFASWLPLMCAPHSAWSTSALGVSAPAYTPAVWLAGIAMLGRRLFWGQHYRWWFYLVGAAVFLVAHITHMLIVYARSQ